MKRTLVILSNGGLTPADTEFQSLQKESDELIIVLVWKNFSDCISNQMTPGKYLVSIRRQVEKYYSQPFYLFPIDASNIPNSQLIIRISHFCPSFDLVVCDDKEISELFRLMTDKEILLRTFSKKIELVSGNIQRSLFITRAQPFHFGHAEFVREALSATEELIILIACAERSFSKYDPATAGERMTLIKAYIQKHFPDRHWIIPMAYNPFIAENFKEAKWLLPHFHILYGSNPVTEEMALYDKISIHKPKINTTIRGSIVRNTIAEGKDYSTMMPKEVMKEMLNLGLDKRIKRLYTEREE